MGETLAPLDEARARFFFRSAARVGAPRVDGAAAAAPALRGRGARVALLSGRRAAMARSRDVARRGAGRRSRLQAASRQPAGNCWTVSTVTLADAVPGSRRVPCSMGAACPSSSMCARAGFAPPLPSEAVDATVDAVRDALRRTIRRATSRLPYSASSFYRVVASEATDSRSCRSTRRAGSPRSLCRCCFRSPGACACRKVRALNVGVRRRRPSQPYARPSSRRRPSTRCVSVATREAHRAHRRSRLAADAGDQRVARKIEDLFVAGIERRGKWQQITWATDDATGGLCGDRRRAESKTRSDSGRVADTATAHLIGATSARTSRSCLGRSP